VWPISQTLPPLVILAEVEGVVAVGPWMQSVGKYHTWKCNSEHPYSRGHILDTDIFTGPTAWFCPWATSTVLLHWFVSSALVLQPFIPGVSHWHRKKQNNSTELLTIRSHILEHHNINKIIIKFITEQKEMRNKTNSNTKRAGKIKYSRNIKKFRNQILLSWIPIKPCNKQKECELAVTKEEREDYWLLGCDTLCLLHRYQCFAGNKMAAASSLKHRYLSVTLHNVTSQKTWESSSTALWERPWKCQVSFKK
jgi:hypothetical protein